MKIKRTARLELKYSDLIDALRLKFPEIGKVVQMSAEVENMYIYPAKVTEEYFPHSSDKITIFWEEEK